MNSTEGFVRQIIEWREYLRATYDRVTVLNFYSMSQYADEGITTKPYLCDSNYILNRSNHPKEGWAETWDGLFWRFIDRHRNTFVKNQRLSYSVHAYD